RHGDRQLARTKATHAFHRNRRREPPSNRDPVAVLLHRQIGGDATGPFREVEPQILGVGLERDPIEAGGESREFDRQSRHTNKPADAGHGRRKPNTGFRSGPAGSDRRPVRIAWFGSPVRIAGSNRFEPAPAGAKTRRESRPARSPRATRRSPELA